MGGNGGLAGKLYSQAIELGALNKGYAIAGTDTGHTGTTFGGRWALYNSRAIENYAHKAVHEVTAVSKDLLVEYYGKKTQRSYFAGCSNGGRMGLMAAQRYRCWLPVSRIGLHRRGVGKSQLRSKAVGLG